MRPNVRVIVLLAAIGLLATGCERTQPPLVEPTGLRLGGIGLAGATLIAEIEIDNPNDVAIETDSITLELQARISSDTDRWTRVTDASKHESVTIEAGGSKVVEVPIQLAYASLGAPVRAILDKGVFYYRVNGVVSVREPRRMSAPFSHTGNLSMTGSR